MKFTDEQRVQLLVAILSNTEHLLPHSVGKVCTEEFLGEPLKEDLSFSEQVDINNELVASFASKLLDTLEEKF